MEQEYRKRKLTRWFSKHTISLAFLLPAVLFVLIFMLYPMCYQVVLSFFRRSSWSRTGSFIGISNYAELLSDGRFWYALKNNALYSVVYVSGVMTVGLILALIIDLRIAGWQFFRFVYYLPVMLMIPVVSVLWGRIYHPYFGLLSRLRHILGLIGPAHAWLGDARVALFAVAFVFIWRSCGWPMIILLSAMSNIPQDLYDAAYIDGATTWQRIRLITLPLIKTVISMATMLQIIWSLKIFTEIWVMTEGGPGSSTEVASVYIFLKAFNSFRMGYASAASVIFSIIVIFTTLVYLKFFGVPKAYDD